MNGGHERDPSIFQRFVHSEVAGSVVLLAATVTALTWANSGWADVYFDLVKTYVGVSWAGASFELSLQHWINDGLMALFFFVVGLEIKRELAVGELSSLRQAVLPVSAAIGGMVVPALIYWGFNAGGAGVSGWGIPMATDIAFALGILAIFGKRAPLGLKVFLTAVAIVDDIGAVSVIALFYTESIRWQALAVALVLLVAIAVVARVGVRGAGVYVPLALGVWLAVLASGVHATVAGILVAMLVPVRAKIDPAEFLDRTRRRLGELEETDLTRSSMLRERRQLEALEDVQVVSGDMLPAGIVLEERLHPVLVFFVLPLFALANAGLPLDGDLLSGLAHPVSLGVLLGLTLGKPIGVLLMSWLAVRSGRAELPEGVTWGLIAGAGCLAGVGFTMSLFISDLAFVDAELVGMAKIGILSGSLLAGVGGFLILRASIAAQGGDR